LQTALEPEMARKKAHEDTPAAPMGPTLAANLERLGFAESVIKTTEVAKLVREKTGKPMSRQRIAALLNAVRITDQTLELIAKGLGVHPRELTRETKPKGKEAK
jgi:hypothetical protein